MPQDTAARILDAACDLIATDGIDEVRIARVAQRAGASTALVHHYFSTREELLEQALIHSFERAGDERFGDEADQPSETATASLARAIRESLPFPGEAQREWVLWVELWLRAVREPDLRPVATGLYQRYTRWIAAIIHGGIESGEFDSSADPDAVAKLAITLLDGTGIRALLEDPDMDVEAARTFVAARLGPPLGLDESALV